MYIHSTYEVRLFVYMLFKAHSTSEELLYVVIAVARSLLRYKHRDRRHRSLLHPTSAPSPCRVYAAHTYISFCFFPHQAPGYILCGIHIDRLDLAVVVLQTRAYRSPASYLIRMPHGGLPHAQASSLTSLSHDVTPITETTTLG